jgi:multiple sugar transport system ATP-binding protein
MGFSLTLAKVKKEEKQRRVAAAAEILALTPLLARYPRQLSGGQRQRVAMGRSIVRDPKVFLFDEPLSNLDAKLRVSMRAEIKSLHQRLGTTIVYVTHDQVEAMTMADKIVVMNDGRIEQIGTPIDLYDNPANVFVATFIGSPAMNIIPGKVSIAGGTKFFRGDDRFEVEVPRSAAVQDGQSVLLGIRPEDFTIGDEGSIDAVIEVVEPMGSQTEVVMLHGNVRIVGSFRQRIAARPTDRIRLTPDIAKASLFDAATQKRIWA